MSDTINPVLSADNPDYSRFIHLRGTGIGIREASRKYNIPQPTISRWVRAGYITVIGSAGNRQTLIDESEIAYRAWVYQSRAGSQGRWIFDKSGKPYIPKQK